MDRQEIMDLAQKANVNWQVLYKISLGHTKDPRVQTLQAIEPHLDLGKRKKSVST